MPLFRRKNTSVPPSDPQPQQHWVAYVYAPRPVPMPSMYPTPYAQHPAFHVPATARYGQLGMQYHTMPVQYVYQKSSTTYSESPQHATNPLTIPQHVRSTVETDYHQTPRRQYRSYSGSQPAPPILTAPMSRGVDFPYTNDEYAVEVKTQPARQGVFTTLFNFARGRSKSRGRNEADPTARPRSRGSFVDDGRDRGRGRTTDPRYVDGRRERRLSNDKELKRQRHESQKVFEEKMIETLEKNLRDGPLQQEDPYHRSSTKEALRYKYEAEDRQKKEYRQSQPVQIPMRPSSRNRPTSPDGLAASPTLLAHTEMNARQAFHRDSGYHTDAPTSKSSRRSSMPLHIMQRSPMEKSATAPKIPEGFFNKRGDQLMNSKGDVLRRPTHLEFPPEFVKYPPPGTGWMDHKGQVSYLGVTQSIGRTHPLHRLSGQTSGGSGRWAEGHCALAKSPDPRTKSIGDPSSETPLCSLVLSFSLSNPTLITHRRHSKTRKSKAFSCLSGC